MRNTLLKLILGGIGILMAGSICAGGSVLQLDRSKGELWNHVPAEGFGTYGIPFQR